MPSSEPSADSVPAQPVSIGVDGGASAGEGEGGAKGFALESEGPRILGERVRYPRTLREYAEVYGGVDEKTIKRWVKRGRLADDLPPLHRPELMPDWFARRMERAVPEAVLLAASEARLSAVVAPTIVDSRSEISEAAPAAEVSDSGSEVSEGTKTPTEGGNPPASGGTPGKERRDFSSVVGVSFEENVHNLRRQLAIQAQLLEEALGETDNGVMASRQRSYRDTMAELRKAETDLQKWQEENGDLARLTEVRAENNRIASTVFNAVVRLVKNVRPQLVGKSDAEQDQIWERETLGCFGILKAAKFTTFEA